MKKEDNCSPSRASGSRRTRSQISPDWTLTDALILVNEIVAVEGECQNAVSSFQKWKIIADNCTVLDVPRTSYQCRRKWDSLLAEYNKIIYWESQSRNNSFWSLGSKRRKELELPENFNEELFKAIDDHVRTQDSETDTDPDSDSDQEADADKDSDPEAEAHTVDVIEAIEPKGQKRLLMSPQSHREGKLAKCNSCEDQKLLQTHTEPKPKPQEKVEEELLQNSLNDEMPQESHEESPRGNYTTSEEEDESEEDLSAEEKEQMMMAKLRENAELIHAIVNGKRNENSKKFKDVDYTDLVRRKGDAIIECLGDIVNTLQQLRVNAQAGD